MENVGLRHTAPRSCSTWALCSLRVAVLANISEACATTAGPVDAWAEAATSDSNGTAVEASTNPWCAPSSPSGYPPGPYGIGNGQTLPELTFPTPTSGVVSLRALLTACDLHPPLLVLRAFAAWSGPSSWHAAHTARLRSFAPAARLRVVDLLVLGQENLPADARDLEAWRARYDTPPDVLALDPEYRFRAVFLTTGQLPVVLFVDPRTMQVLTVRIAPTQDQLEFDVGRFEAQLAGHAPPVPSGPTLLDERFSTDQWEQILAMSPVPAPPSSPTNRYADDPNAAALGRALFSDPRLSPSGSVSCASCHEAAMNFADGRPTARGVGTADRNAPSLLFASHARWQFWDGRADSLWSQALGPLENPLEMASSRLYVAHRIATTYAEPYARVFGPLPALHDAARFPPAGAPGDPAWERMMPADRASVDRVFVQVGKALEAFERTLRTRPTRFDAYVAGNYQALTATERDGLQEFMTFGCVQCHHGPLFTDQSFHNVLFPTGRADGAADRGRIDGIGLLIDSPFRADGAFSDVPAGASGVLSGLRASPSMLGAFRTPSLRGVATTGPWGHGGTFRTLRELVVHYSQRSSTERVPGTVGTPDLHLNGFHMAGGTVDHITAFLMSLDDLAVAP